MLVTNTEALKQKISEIIFCDTIAIDTEFVRDKFYYPKLSLIQFAGNNIHFAVDALSDIDLQVLKPLLQKKSITKIFHSCRQDLEVLHNYFGFIPPNLFDTQIAMLFLGYNEPPGYEALILDLLGKKLDKQFQYSDWLRRPLSDEQVKYAYDDVILLLEAYPKILTQLEDLDRTKWLKEECDTLQQETNFLATEEELLRKFVGQLDNTEQAYCCLKVLRSREIKAKNLNKPRSRILHDRNIMTVVKFNGKPKGSLLSKEEIEEAIHAPNTDTDIQLVEKCIKLSKLRRSKKVESFMELRKALNTVAESKKISPALIATSDEIMKFANGIKKNIRFLSGWRKGIFGNQALQIIEEHS